MDSFTILWGRLVVKGRVIFSRRPGEGEVDEPYNKDCWRLWESVGLRKRAQTPTTDLMVDSMTKPQNMKAKVLKRHYAETTSHEIHGGDIYPPLD